MKLIKESLKYEIRRYTKEDRELGYPVIFDSKAEALNRMDIAGAEYLGNNKWSSPKFNFVVKEIEE